MTLTKDDKTEIIGQYARSAGDTGSAEVQVAVLTKRIADLTEHLKLHTRIMRRGGACSRWSADDAGSWNTSSVRTSSAIARSSRSSVSAANTAEGAHEAPSARKE